MEQHFQYVVQKIIHDNNSDSFTAQFVKKYTKTDPTTMSQDYVFQNNFHGKHYWFDGKIGWIFFYNIHERNNINYQSLMIQV